jgi:hypothetical protein
MVHTSSANSYNFLLDELPFTIAHSTVKLLVERKMRALQRFLVSASSLRASIMFSVSVVGRVVLSVQLSSSYLVLDPSFQHDGTTKTGPGSIAATLGQEYVD